MKSLVAEFRHRVSSLTEEGMATSEVAEVLCVSGAWGALKTRSVYHPPVPVTAFDLYAYVSSLCLCEATGRATPANLYADSSKHSIVNRLNHQSLSTSNSTETSDRTSSPK